MAVNKVAEIRKKTYDTKQTDIQERFGDGPYKLNLGSGRNHLPDMINIDTLDDAELQLDLECYKLPFPKGSVVSILASHIMEHLKNFPQLMNECHRVLAPNGKMVVRVPCYPSVECFQDPTHVRYFTDRSFFYFDPGHELYKQVGESYGFLPWRVIDQRIVNGWELVVGLKKVTP